MNNLTLIIKHIRGNVSKYATITFSLSLTLYYLTSDDTRAMCFLCALAYDTHLPNSVTIPFQNNQDIYMVELSYAYTNIVLKKNPFVLI